MANKKLQNNQNRKNTEGPTMNGNHTSPTTTASSIQHQTNSGGAASSNNNNSSGSSNATGGTSTSTNTAYSQQQQHNHQRLSSTSSQHNNSSKQQQQQPPKKTLNNEVEKINPNVGSQSNQGGYRSGGGGNKDQRIKEKEKERNPQGGGNNRQGNQPNHHHHVNHNTGGGGNQQQQQQNARKKDNKGFQNRDLSNNSHRGGYTNSHGPTHHHQSSSVEHSKLGFPSNTSLSSAAGFTSPTPSIAPTAPQVHHESKTVQTEVKVKKERPPRQVKKEEETTSPFKSNDPKNMDTVMAFQEQDEWNKVEMMCELLYLLSPTDLRLVLNCIEGAIRCYTNQMRPVEKTSNSTDPTECLPQFVCCPPPQPPVLHTEDFNQRSIMTNLLSAPPGLPSLVSPVQNLVMSPEQQNYSLPSSSTSPPSSVSNKEMVNGVPTTTTAGGVGTSAEPDSARSAPKASTPEPEPVIPTSQPPPPSRPAPVQSTPPVPQEPEKFLGSVRDLTGYLYTLMSVCASTNRKSAAKISEYVKGVLLREKNQILERIPNELDKIDVLQDIGKIIAAMTHHPAVTLDDKMSYADMRDGLRSEIETLFRQYYAKESERKLEDENETGGVGDLEDTEDSDEEYEEDEYEMTRRLGGIDLQSRFMAQTSSQSVPGTFFITRFIGRHVEGNDHLFSLEIHWSDGDRTYTQRSRDQLKALQHRLLDEFGQQRSEKFNHPQASFDEESSKKQLSASTSTMETSFAHGGERIVPRLARDATPTQYVQYINELSDLPARMMLSPVICEEFNGTRSRTQDLLQETRNTSDGLIFSRWKNPRAKSPIRFFQRNSLGLIEPVHFPVTIQPFLYSNTPQTQQQILYPSCSNCGGQHGHKMCDKPTMLEKKGPEHKLRPEQEAVAQPNAQVGTSPNPNYYAPMPAQMAHPMFMEAPPGMIPANHFNHHHQQQMMQNTIFHNGVPYRPANPQYDGHVQMMYMAPAPIPNANPPSGNTSGNSGSGGSSNGGGGGNPNTNF